MGKLTPLTNQPITTFNNKKKLIQANVAKTNAFNRTPDVTFSQLDKTKKFGTREKTLLFISDLAFFKCRSRYFIFPL